MRKIQTLLINALIVINATAIRVKCENNNELKYVNIGYTRIKIRLVGRKTKRFLKERVTGVNSVLRNNTTAVIA